MTKKSLLITEEPKLSRGKNKYLLESGNPRLLKRPIKNGTVLSLYLEYHYGYNRDNGSSVRKRESLSLFLFPQPHTPEERAHNKDVIGVAKNIRREREQQFLENREGYRLKKNKAINFLDFFQAYINNYTKKDIRVIEMAFRAFKKFLADKYPHFAKRIEPQQISRQVIIDFTEHIRGYHRGMGIKTVYGRFKKVINFAIEQGIFPSNPCKGISVEENEDILAKDILSSEELIKMWFFRNLE